MQTSGYHGEPLLISPAQRLLWEPTTATCELIETGFSGANKLLGDSKAKDECKILGGAKKLLKGTIAECSDSESEEKGGDYEQHEKKLAKEAEIKEF